MTVYHWLVVLVLVLALLMHGERKRNLSFVLLASALLFCVYGLRDAYSVGVDTTSSYLHQFERMAETETEDLPGLDSWLGTAEQDENVPEGHTRNIAFEWMMKLGYDWTEGDYQFFIASVSLFVICVFAFFIYKYSPSPVQSILLYCGLLYFTFNFSALKQSVSMAFIMLAMDAILNRKLLRFLVFTLIASMFHFPAIVFLPAYWIAQMRPGRTYILLLAAAFVLTYLFRDQLLEWMTDNYDTEIIDTGRSFLANKVIIMIVILAAAIVIRPPTREDRAYSAFLMLIGVAAVIQTFSSYNNTFERLADYYFQFSVVFIPMVFEDVKLKRRHLSERELTMVRRVGPYLFGAFAIWRFIDYVQNPEAMLLPYQFYFQAEKAEETLSAFLHFMT